MSTPLTPTVKTDLTCWKCDYSLAGLLESGQCPECGVSIAESEQHAIQLATSHLEPLPPWLRVLRTAYFTAFFTLFAAPFVLPSAARSLGMPVVRHNDFMENCGTLGGGIGILGFFLLLLLAAYKRSGQAMLIVLLWLLGAICMPAIGNT